MLPPADSFFDAASAISIGKRDYQEDAVISDCPLGGEFGLVVLCDGMGGHAAGDVASKIVLTEVFSELRLQADQLMRAEADICAILRSAANAANDCVRAYVESYPETRGMGATLVAACLRGNQLHWLSIGDSALYLYRDGVLRKLNEEHSLGAEMDKLVGDGQMCREFAEGHPDRNYLTSVVCGEKIARIDCPQKGFELREDDIVLAASDGLEFLARPRLDAALRRTRTAQSARIAASLLDEIEQLGDPDQDNVSVAVVKIARHAELPELKAETAEEPVELAAIKPVAARMKAKPRLGLGSGRPLALTERVN